MKTDETEAITQAAARLQKSILELKDARTRQKDAYAAHAKADNEMRDKERAYHAAVENLRIAAGDTIEANGGAAMRAYVFSKFGEEVTPLASAGNFRLNPE